MAGAVMNNALYTGKLVHLTAVDPETYAASMVKWRRDSEFLRLMDSDPARQFSIKEMKEWAEKQQEKNPPANYWFLIRKLDQDQIIGDIGLFEISWPAGDSFVGVGIGERDLWGNGYGTDAMNVILRYAFTELCLHRVSLTVFEYNPRGLRSYQKCGFREEGRLRQYLHRDGRRWDLIFMGLLREEWHKLNRES
jgi:RimJ/RimL family protein N-acetyltransferase